MARGYIAGTVPTVSTTARAVVPLPGRILPPLAVDLDGTLSRSDTLQEGLIGCLKSGAGRVPELLRALRQGKAAFKRRVSWLADIDPSVLPYNQELVAYLVMQKQAGRRIGLFTGADQSVADGVGGHLGLFDVVRGSDGRTNLTGAAKVAAIRQAFGASFSYAGDAPVDRAVFAEADSVVLVGAVRGLRARLPAGKPVEAEFPSSRNAAGGWISALRLPHWIKNSLVLVAPVLGIRALTTAVALQALLLFVLMGVLASATYLINDLFDLAADRRHPMKRFRPFAAGTLPAATGLMVAVTLICAAVLGSILLFPWMVSALLVGYLVLTLSYSLSLKRVPMVDVLLLAGLFTIRIAAGGALALTPQSPWLLTFSMLFFLSLAMAKRYAELERVCRTESPAATARGYDSRDLPMLLASGVAAGIAAVVIFTIYLINEQYPRHLYAIPGVLWGIMPILLVWILRIWYLGVHGRLNEDPVIYAVHDRTSLALGALVLLTLLVAWL